MLPYIFVFAILFAFALIEITVGPEHSLKKWMFYASIAIMTLFMGLRWETGCDWNPYLNIFKNASSMESLTKQGYSHRMEKAYLLFNIAVRKVTDNYSVFLLIQALFFYTLMFFAFKRMTPYPQATILVFFGAHIASLGIQRQLVASAIVMYAVPYLINRKRIIFLLGVFSASLFHNSAVATSIYLFLTKRLKTVTLCAIVLGALIISQTPLPEFLLRGLGKLFGGLIEQKLSFYIEDSHKYIGTVQPIKGIIKRLVFTVLFVAVRDKIAVQNKYYNLMLNIYVLNCALYLLFNGVLFGVADRVSMYFGSFESALVVMPLLFIRSIKLRIAYIIGLLLLSGFLFYRGTLVYSDLFFPYKGVFINTSFYREMY